MDFPKKILSISDSLLLTAAPSCSMKSSDMGPDYFLMFIEGHGDILYQCDFGFVFNKTQCGCVKEGNQFHLYS